MCSQYRNTAAEFHASFFQHRESPVLLVSDEGERATRQLKTFVYDTTAAEGLASPEALLTHKKEVDHPTVYTALDMPHAADHFSSATVDPIHLRKIESPVGECDVNFIKLGPHL